MATAPLISLAAVKEWLNTGNAPYPPNSDSLLTRMIGAVSNFAVTWCSRPFAPITVTEQYNGTGRRTVTLRQQPVILVRSVVVGTTSITARTTPGGTGFVFDDASVSLACGQCFWPGLQNVVVQYDAGCQTTDSETGPVSGPLTIDAGDLSRPWNSDRGVAYASGAALQLVTSTPTVTGTYQVTGDPPASNSKYVFAPGDAGASIVITYGYTPEDVQQALLELLGERFKSRARIGETSQSLGGQMTVAFSQRDMNAAIRTMLQSYRNVTPIP